MGNVYNVDEFIYNEPAPACDDALGGGGLVQCGVELWLPQVRSIDRSGEKSKHAMETQLFVRLYTRTRYNYGKTGRLHDTFNTPPPHKLRSIDRQSVSQGKEMKKMQTLNCMVELPIHHRGSN